MCHCVLNFTLLHTVDLDLGNFTSELREMTPNWYAFGAALGLSITDLEIIEDKGSPQRYLIAMLEEWMKTKQDEEVTWEALQKALRKIDNNRLAVILEEHKLKEHKLKGKQLG